MTPAVKHLTIALLIAVLFLSCYNGEKENKMIFHYNESTGIASIDPAFAKNQSIMWAVHQLYNTLVEVDSNLHGRLRKTKKPIPFFYGPMFFFRMMNAFQMAVEEE